MEIHSVDSTESRENKKKSYPQWELNPGTLILMPCMLLSEKILRSEELIEHDYIRI